MTCEQVKEQIADYLAGDLSASTSENLREHFEQCPACKQEAESLSETWKMLGLLEQEHPNPAVRTRFYDSLDAYRQGVAAAAAVRPRNRWFNWNAWRQFGFPQVAVSIALLVIGVIGGQWLGNRQRGEGDLAKLQDEVQHMRQLVTLSLLQQQSASERLRGVDYAYRVEGSDTQVLSALLYAVNHDPNVNVRLAAVDALRRFSGSPVMHNTLDKALVKQDSPLVQIALIDLIVETRDKGAAPALQALKRRPDANKDVQERAVWGLSQLQ